MLVYNKKPAWSNWLQNINFNNLNIYDIHEEIHQAWI